MTLHFPISEINGSAAFGRSGGVFLNKEKLPSSVMDVPAPEEDEEERVRISPLTPMTRISAESCAEDGPLAKLSRLW